MICLIKRLFKKLLLNFLKIFWINKNSFNHRAILLYNTILNYRVDNELNP